MSRLTLLLAILLFQHSAFAVVTSDEAGSHVTTPGQPAFGVDLDGVFAIASGDADSVFEDLIPLCSGTLIADRYALTAAHCLDQDGDGVVDKSWKVWPLILAFESSDGPQIVSFDAYDAQFAPQWPSEFADLAILPLPEGAPSNLPRYPLYGLNDEVGKPITLAGYGLTGFGRTGEEDVLVDDRPTKRAGRNRYEDIRDETLLIYDFDSGFAQHNALTGIDGNPDLGFGADEVVSASADSGGPVFVHGAIAGTTASGERIPETDSNSVLDSSWGELGRDTRVSAFRSFINNATEGEAVFLDLLGDFDFNGVLNSNDIDALAHQIRAVELIALYDLDHSGVLDANDHRLWVKTLKRTWYGDANLDGYFNSSDLVDAFDAGQYEDGAPTNSGWAEGDWNGNAEFDTGDIVLAFQDGGYEQGQLVDASVVPEPTSLVLLMAGFIGIAIRRRVTQQLVGRPF